MKRIKVLVALTCILLPLASLYYKYSYLNLPMIPKKASNIWKVELALHWENIERATNISDEQVVFPVPNDLPSQRISNLRYMGKSLKELKPKALQDAVVPPVQKVDKKDKKTGEVKKVKSKGELKKQKDTKTASKANKNKTSKVGDTGEKVAEKKTPQGKPQVPTIAAYGSDLDPAVIQIDAFEGKPEEATLSFEAKTRQYNYLNDSAKTKKLPKSERKQYLNLFLFGDEDLELLRSLSSTLAFDSDSKQAKMEKFFFYLADEISLKHESNSVKDVVELSNGSYLAQARVLLGLARLNKIPARLSFGIQFLEQEEEDKARYTRFFFTEAYINGQWLPYFPERRLQGRTDGNQIILHRGSMRFADFFGQKELFSILVKPVKLDPMSSEEQIERLQKVSPFWATFSLHRFSLSIQAIFLGIVLVPFGTIILSFARVVIGVNTFGIFMPILLTLFFLETSFVFGFTFFSVIVLVGLMQRALLDRFYLLAVPRLSILLAIVIFLYILFAVGADSLGLLSVNHKTLSYFPIVIITIFIERLSIYFIEEGGWNTVRTAIGTFVVATLCYYLLAFKWLKVFLFNNPEVLLLAIGINMVIGSYRGYRLLELMRFNQVKESNDFKFS